MVVPLLVVVDAAEPCAEEVTELLADVLLVADIDVVVAERLVTVPISVVSLAAVFVAFGAADHVLSVLPQAVMLIIVALIIKAAMAFIVFFIWFSSFLDLTYILK